MIHQSADCNLPSLTEQSMTRLAELYKPGVGILLNLISANDP